MDEYFDINSICQRLWYFFITVLVIVIISITVVFSLNKINKRYHSNNDNDARRFTATEKYYKLILNGQFLLGRQSLNRRFHWKG